MGRNRQLALVLIVAIVIAAIGSHFVATWLKVKTTAAEPYIIGNSTSNPPAFMAGSSLSGYGIAWEEISTQFDQEIKTWGIAAASPYEEEQFQKLVPDANLTFIVVSAYDLDEANLSDFRAAIVPIDQSIEMLRATHADWQDTKLVLSQYPITWLRTAFPTLGRSRGVMGKFREKAVMLFKHTKTSPGTEAGPTLNFGKETVVDSYKMEKISDWSKAQLIGKAAAMRAGIQGKQGFNGAKRLAFERMLQYGVKRGRTIIIVLPLSPYYTKEFMSPEMVQRFEASLDEVQRQVPRAEWVRLDQMPQLAANENFCDLVHMNVFGKHIATDALQTWLKQPVRQP